MPNGWLGYHTQLLHTLRMFGADRDADGTFLISGSVSSFMGAGEEVCVGEDARYYVGGEPRSLVLALGGTSYGMHVTVIS